MSLGEEYLSEIAVESALAERDNICGKCRSNAFDVNKKFYCSNLKSYMRYTQTLYNDSCSFFEPKRINNEKNS